ncbi:MAG TPA: FecR domain-containing protein [Prolixibacteraceae bacterium]|nr:FecR domain-containing protein [Prolixibacteraceae bacterium]
MDYSIINKYFAGEASETEVQEVFQWINSDLENRKEFIQYKKVWALTTKLNQNPDKIWNEISSKLTKLKKQLNINHYWIMAAGFLLVFGLGTMMHYIFPQESQEQFSYLAGTRIEVPLGQMSNVILPDGTTVQLNSGTKLVYSGKFNSGERMVSLEGEAFFDVTKDQSHPFVIKTNTLDIKVYGTSFNIQAYPEDKKINTTLVEGSLGIFGKNGSELIRLVPGENATYNEENRKLLVGEVNLDLYTSWKDGLITFRNEKLKDIARKIERWYNVEIIIENDRVGEEIYLGTILKNKPIDQILEIFAMTSSLKYRIVSRADQPTLIYWE